MTKIKQLLFRIQIFFLLHLARVCGARFALFMRFRIHIFFLLHLARARAWWIVTRARLRAPRHFDCFATGAPVSPTAKGTTTFVWGTKPSGTQVFPVVSAATVTSLKLTPVNGGPVVDIDNPDGSCISSIFLDDGFNAEGEMLYDSALTYPALYAALTLVLPKAVDFSSGAAYANFPCIIESFGVAFERKKEAMISFKLSHRPGRDGAPS